jgi:phenylacetate-CoA ligase
MTLRCEAPGADAEFRARVAVSIRDICSLRGEVELVSPGTLPNDGRVIEDLRPAS